MMEIIKDKRWMENFDVIHVIIIGNNIFLPISKNKDVWSVEI